MFLANPHIRQQPWSTYAVQLTTLSPPAFIGDAALWWFLAYGTCEWSKHDKLTAYYALAAWMTFSKLIKLVPHFIRFPVDIFLWPISVIFGWCHGIIKCHAMFTLNEVSNWHPHRSITLLTNDKTTWGSRAGADASDSERMVKQNQKSYGQQHYSDEKAFPEKIPLNDSFTNTQAMAA